ncbi:MAG TPA: transglycosylase domain-containing protein [Nitrospinota bacterium]|nr:transglycosylase domain-containing protein [Nitrospinota bacterium]
MTTNYTFQTLNLEYFPTWRKCFEAFKFLPKALRCISSRQLVAKRTFLINDRNGHPIGISGGDIIYPLTQKEISDIRHLLIELEDRRYYLHHGIDIKALVRALFWNIISRKIIQGGSTITQQLVRNTLLTSDKSLIRKSIEAFLALQIEKYYSKEEILNLYCQYVYLGGGIRGFSAASKVIYRKPLSSLNYNQICGLLGLLRLPSITYPLNSTQNYLRRQKFISKILLKYSTEKENKDRVWGTINPINISKVKKQRLSHILNRIIESEFGNIHPYIAKVELTIDLSLQGATDRVLKEVSSCPNISQVAAVILSNNTGEILVESSWKNGVESEFSPVFSGSIQAGSTFKTFALLAAIEQRFNLDMVLESSPFKSSFIKDIDKKEWTIRNYGNIYRGGLTLKQALKYSDNTVFARLTEILDFKDLVKTFNRFGLSEISKATPSLIFGATPTGISLIKLSSAYRAIQQNGVYTKPILIKNVQLTGGSLLWKSKPSDSTIVAHYVDIIELKHALKYSGITVFGKDFSGKTGTTSSGSLFVGYNDNISLAIWLGYSKSPSEDIDKEITSRHVLQKLVQKMLGYKSNLFSI